MEPAKIALVTGATSGIGREVALALLRHGWTVRALARSPETARASVPAAIDWIGGDAMSRDDLVAAAGGTSLVFHGANPPAYKNWRGLAIPMFENCIAAAESAGARLVYPGSVYVYGPDAGPLVSETAPQNPKTRKGKIRVEMEQMLHTAAGRGLRTLIVRAGDYFGPYAPSSWVNKALLADGAKMKVVTTPEVLGAHHAWAYLPDVAETVASLADIEQSLPLEARFHFSGQALKNREMAESVQRASGATLPIRTFSWLPIYLAAPFVTFCREVIEMRYLWSTSLQLDNAKLVQLLGREPHTELDRAVQTSANAVRQSHQQALA